MNGDGGRSETISDGETKRADADELHQYVLSVGRNFDHWVLQKIRLPGIPASRLCIQGDQGIIP